MTKIRTAPDHMVSVYFITSLTIYLKNTLKVCFYNLKRCSQALNYHYIICMLFPTPCSDNANKLDIPIYIHSSSIFITSLGLGLTVTPPCYPLQA